MEKETKENLYKLNGFFSAISRKRKKRRKEKKEKKKKSKRKIKSLKKKQKGYQNGKFPGQQEADFQHLHTQVIFGKSQAQSHPLWN
jgi:hypothetical protein